MRLGVFGGTFDPPHVAHLILASEAYHQLQLDRLLWVLTPDPPHKQGQSISPASQRLELLQAAITGDSHFELSTVELDRPGPHYAVDTVNLLKAQFPQWELFYLIGGDSLRDMPSWHQPQALIEAVSGFGVMRRPGDKIESSGVVQKLPGISTKVQFIDAPVLEISATAIRERIAENRPFRYYLLPSVYERILAGCYYSKCNEEDRS